MSFRSDSMLFNRANTNSIGMIRDSATKDNVPNAFAQSNELKGDFIAQIFPDGLVDKSVGDVMFDPFLASVKQNGALTDYGLFDRNTDYRPFLAIVNVQEISHIITPNIKEGKAPTKKDLEKIASIALTCGVFRLDNWMGQFAIPNYGDAVKVMYGDPEVFGNPIFISPMNNGGITRLGELGGNSKGSNSSGKTDKSGFFKDCAKLKKLAKVQRDVQSEVNNLRADLTAATGGGATTTLAPQELQALKDNTAQAEQKLADVMNQRDQLAANFVNPGAGTVDISAGAFDINYFCKKPAGAGGSLVGKKLGPGKVINKYPNNPGKFMTYDKDAKCKEKLGKRYFERKFPPINIVMHDTDTFTGMPFGSYRYFATNKDLVSTHYIIGEDGTIIEALNPLLYYARHAGNWNRTSIGIDMCCKPFMGSQTVAGKTVPIGERFSSDPAIKLKAYIGKSDDYIKGATSHTAPSADPYPYDVRTKANIANFTPPYLTRATSGAPFFTDYTAPQKEALYALVSALLEEFAISPVTVLKSDLANSPDKLKKFPQRFSGVVSHMQVSNPGERGDGHRALDLLVEQGILIDLAGWDKGSKTFTTPNGIVAPGASAPSFFGI